MYIIYYITVDPYELMHITYYFSGIFQYQISSINEELREDIMYEFLVRKFLWAQWDPVQQTLYYIHNRKRNKCLVEGEEEELTTDNDKVTPTLSGLQFNDEVPHETVVNNIVESRAWTTLKLSTNFQLNIPLNLPHFSSMVESCMIYEDDAVPLRIHDCSLDLVVLTDSNGFVCICHHYLYQVSSLLQFRIFLITIIML